PVREVLEDEEGVEERCGTGELLQPGEADMVMFGERGLSTLQVDEEVGDAPGRVGAEPYRDGVDEQAEDVVDPVEFGGPPGDGDPEDDVVAPGEPGQQQAPCCLDEDSDGHAEGTGGLGESGGLLLTEFSEEFLLGSVTAVGVGVGGEQGRSGQVGE